jgi:hypothetical protein
MTALPLRSSRVCRSSKTPRAIYGQLTRYGNQNGEGWADIIDLLTMYPEARRKVARLLGELEGRSD